MSDSLQIMVGFLGQAVTMMIIPFAANKGGTTAFRICFSVLLLYGIFTGVAQGACYSINAKLPHSYIQIFLTAQGIAGILSSVLRLSSLYIWPSEDDPSNDFKSVLFNFVIGACVCFMCVPAQCYMTRSKFAKYHITMEDQRGPEMMENLIHQDR